MLLILYLMVFRTCQWWILWEGGDNSIANNTQSNAVQFQCPLSILKLLINAINARQNSNVKSLKRLYVLVFSKEI
jgi:hypothetical protein